VADVHTPVPERPGSTFGDGFRLDVDGHTLAFTDSGNGVYKDVGAGLQKVADVNTRVPGSDLFSLGSASRTYRSRTAMLHSTGVRRECISSTRDNWPR
jgi:hypothetical protein